MLKYYILVTTRISSIAHTKRCLNDPTISLTYMYAKYSPVILIVAIEKGLSSSLLVEHTTVG